MQVHVLETFVSIFNLTPTVRFLYWSPDVNNKIEFGIYRKDADRYIREEGFNPLPLKHAVLISIPLQETEYKKEYQNIIKITEKNGFNKALPVVDKKAQKTESS